MEAVSIIAIHMIMRLNMLADYTQAVTHFTIIFLFSGCRCLLLVILVRVERTYVAKIVKLYAQLYSVSSSRTIISY